MNQERRRLMVLGAAAATLAGLRSGVAADAPPIFRLEAQPIGGTAPDASQRLGYGKDGVPPILRLRMGEVARLSLKNGLGEATALDLQGWRGPAAAYPGPTQSDGPIVPGAARSLDINPGESGTVWFHPPFMPGWSDQTSRGLSGVLIVEETTPPIVDEDIVLLLADSPAANGSDVAARLFVNGHAPPETRICRPGSRLRLRLVNGSTRLALAARFSGARAMVIAIDGQPSELFRPLDDTLPVGPGARFDVLVDLPQAPSGDAAAFRLAIAIMNGSSPMPTGEVLTVAIAGDARAESRPIVPLAPNPALPRAIPLEKATRVELAIQKTAAAPTAAVYAINGATSIDLPKVPLFKARRNIAVAIGFANRTPDLIGFRLHGHAVRVLHVLDDGWEPYWRDSILIPPGKTFHVAFVPDTAGRFLLDSPFFAQATTGLRRWFEVL